MRLLPKRIKWPALLAVGVVLAGAGTAYAVTTGADAPAYRTVTATRGDVEQTLRLTGLVDAARRADLAFGTSGTVARVKVAQGDKVRAGQVIATLETDDLDAAVTDAVATLARAKAQLASDEDAQSSSVQDAASPTGNGKPTGAGGPDNGQDNGQGSTSAETAALLKKLKAEQEAVVSAQSAASAALAAAADALSAQTAACADAYQAPAASDAPTDGSSPSATGDDSQNAACDSALADVQAKQAAVKQAQDDLADALDELGGTLTSALGSLSGAQQPTAKQPAAKQPAAKQSAARAAASADATTPTASDSSSSSQTTVTAARLASDQAQIDQAEADLLTAEAARAQATLRSTRSGTVASLDLAKGDSVSTGTTVAVVVGGTAVTLTGTVPEASVGKLKVGQQARISVPGSSATTLGTVTAIGLIADTSTGSTTYPVTVTVEDPTIALPTGSSAQVSVVLSTAKDVVTLPISAISRNGDNAVVRTWDGKSLKSTQVTLGAVGATTVAVTAGVTPGTRVVIADADQAITGASSELNQRGGFSLPGGGQFTFRGGGGGGGPTFSKAN